MTNDSRLVAVDVGQGNCTVVVSEGKAALVDCPGQGVNSALGALDAEGSIGPLDLVVATHRDIDHIAGIPQILTRRGAKELIFNRSYGLPEGKNQRIIVKAII